MGSLNFTRSGDNADSLLNNGVGIRLVAGTTNIVLRDGVVPIDPARSATATLDEPPSTSCRDAAGDRHRQRQRHGLSCRHTLGTGRR
jgi:hypothetical protein